MKYVLSSVVFILGISVWNMKPSQYNISEKTVCDELDYLSYELQRKHVTSLTDTKSESLKDLYNKAFEIFIYELDPMRIVFSQKQVDAFHHKNKFYELLKIKEQKTCLSFYRVIDLFNSEMKRLEIEFRNINDQEIYDLVKDQKRFKKFMANVSEKEEWPKSGQELKENLQWSLLTGFREVRSHVQSDQEALKVAKRMFERQIFVNKLQSLSQTKSEISKALLYVMDAHSQFFSNEEFSDVMQSLTSSFVGVGIIVSEVGPGYKVVKIIKGGPAERQRQMQVGDVITHVNGISVEGVSRRELSKYLSGTLHSVVRLQVARDEGKVSFISLRRDYVKNKQAEIHKELVSYRGSHLGLIKLTHFYTGNEGEPGVANQVESILKDFKSKHLKGLIIDLRGNGGGILEEVVQLAGLFFTSAPITIEVSTADRGVQVHADQDGKSLFDGPLVVLVDESSASASEILAGSLKSLNRAVIIGSEQTYGKGTIQEIGPVESVLNSQVSVEGALKLTVGHYYLPDGSSVQFDGVKPHVVLSEVKTKTKNRRFEKDLPYALTKPESIDFRYDPSNQWMSESQFQDLLRYIKAENRARDFLKVATVTPSPEKQIKNKAFNILSDMIEYSTYKANAPMASTIR